MAGTSTKLTHPHDDRELCDEAVRLYTEALRKGRIPRADLSSAPCLVDLALLHSDPQDTAWMCPLPPSAALTHLLQPITREINERVERTASLVHSLAPLTSLVAEDPNLAINVIEGKPLIDAAVGDAVAVATKEVWTVQPGSSRSRVAMMRGRDRSLGAIERGAQVRHLYQHSSRYRPHVKEYLEHVPTGRLEVRTVEQTIERLIVVDRSVAFIPGNAERTTALEIRHPAVVAYLVQTYEVLWSMATPMTELLEVAPRDAVVTPVQQSIAKLLVEGIGDEVVARRMGISVRTCRSHIAKLMQALNASSRTHLGALLVQSGLVEPETGSPSEIH
ncbi:LuxR C-terminal-related transcriptional regulator [Streptomyces sp. NPDC057307]|uniref:helix-turn-helix transcriptional regulator n=1 Tax=Streptomyces sp. NPDC057307 TaxID=3346096 RepID=UPI0036332366